MFKTSDRFLIIAFIIVTVVLMLLLVTFIVSIIYRYQQKQNVYFKDIETLKINYQNTLLQSQLEIQEQTFQSISREIHDGVGQKLTLAKLRLNTLNFNENIASYIDEVTQIIGEVIADLSDISKSMSCEIILNNGIIKALEYEVTQLQKSGTFVVKLSTTGNPIFMDTNTELVLFRIAQEAIANIIKHAKATTICIQLHYMPSYFNLQIIDDGIGFDEGNYSSIGTGLLNIKKRAAILQGSATIASSINSGTTISIQIPLHEQHSIT
jgi:two-component system, NarL family, sensor kinase